MACRAWLEVHRNLPLPLLLAFTLAFVNDCICTLCWTVVQQLSEPAFRDVSACRYYRLRPLNASLPILFIKYSGSDAIIEYSLHASISYLQLVAVGTITMD
jgi:hypothetical protein